MTPYDVIIIGGGASGLMCALQAGQRGRRVLVLDRSNKVGKKILMSGGGRCNFMNLFVEAEHFLSENPHFCISALSRYTQWDFMALVEGRMSFSDGVLTERLHVANGVLPVQTRTPVVLGMAAASLNHLAPGRFALGLGLSSRTIVDQ